MRKVDEYKNKPHSEIVQKIYQKALNLINDGTVQQLLDQLETLEKSNLQVIIENFERGKGVLLISS